MEKVELYQASYASEVMNSVPYGFIDKTVCGCGMTSVGIESNENCIIAVPNKELITNKISQYPNKRCPYRLLGVKGGVSTEEIDYYISSCTNQPIKIICTWDSIGKVSHLVDQGIRLIIDESDNIITNAPLKTDKRDDRDRMDIINQLLSLAKNHKDTISFITATPIPLKYLPDWISNIDQVKYEWANTTTVIPIKMKRQAPYLALKKEIIIPLKNSESLTIGDRTFKKVVVFINSVSQITEICRECNLDKEEVSILCGDSLYNDSKVRGYNKLNYTNLTKFNFITSSGFQGIDLQEDESCMNVVVSCTDATHHLVDLATSLKQAISRNRSRLNPCRDRFIFIYNQAVFDKSEKELLEDLDNVKARILANIKTLDLNPELASYNETTFLQSKDFVSYALKDGNNYTFNENRFMYDIYFILEVRKSYIKGFQILGEGIEIKESRKAYNEGNNYNNLYKLAIAGESLLMYQGSDAYKLLMDYYTEFGAYCENSTWAATRLSNLEQQRLLYKLKDQLPFKVGCVYTRKEIKDTLQKVYDNNNIIRKAKATDLEEFYNLKATTKMNNNKRENGYQIKEK